MHPFLTCGRPPRARLDPIRSAADVIALMATAVSQPYRHELVGLVLDDAGLGSTIVIVDDVPPGDDGTLVHFAEVLATAAQGVTGAAALVLVTVRPSATDACDLFRPGDIDLWLEASDIVEQHGLRLLEWFVVGPAGIACPRDRLGEPARW